MRATLVRLTLAAVFATGHAAVARAQSDPPVRSELRGQLGASINNAGLQNTLEMTWIRPRISAGVVHGLTPAQTRLGGWLQISPLPVFDLRAGVDPSIYFGTFNSLQGFDSYEQAFDKDARDARAGAKAGYALRTYLAPTVKLKAGPIAAAVTAELEWWRSNEDAPYFYEPTRDTLLKSSGDRLMTTSSVVLWQRGSMSAGAIHTSMRVFDAQPNDVQKLGAIAIHQSRGRRFGLSNPRVTVIVAKYLEDPSKDGQWTAAAAVGFRAVRTKTR